MISDRARPPCKRGPARPGMAEQQAGWLITLLHGRELSVCSAVCLDINHAHVCLKSEVHRPPPRKAREGDHSPPIIPCSTSEGRPQKIKPLTSQICLGMRRTAGDGTRPAWRLGQRRPSRRSAGKAQVLPQWQGWPCELCPPGISRTASLRTVAVKASPHAGHLPVAQYCQH